MGMPSYHRTNSYRFRIDVEFIAIVQDKHPALVKFDDLTFGKLRGPSAFVDVAAYRDHGRDRAQLFQYGRTAHVAGMDDQIAASHRRGGRLAQ